MASLLVFHLLGLYPVPASKQLLLGSPFVSGYTLKNDLLGTSTKFTVENFDNSTLQATPSNSSSLYVSSVTINGIKSATVCWIDFDDVVGGGEIVIELSSDGTSAAQAGCGTASDSLPYSLDKI